MCMKPLDRWVKNKRGIYYVWVVAIVLIFVTTIVWLVLVYVQNVTIDAFESSFEDLPQGQIVSDLLRDQGGIIVLVIDGLLLGWALISSFRKERQEIPVAGPF